MKKKILYIEDNEFVIEVIKDLLETENFDIEHYYTVDEGISAFNSGTFDLVLMDLHLKQTHNTSSSNGMDLLWHIRNRKKSLIPVIVTTGMELIKAKDVLEHGASLFYHKHDIDWGSFITDVNNLLKADDSKTLK